MTSHDTTYCASSPQCATTDCPRHFGDAARETARRLGIAEHLSFADFRPGCGDYRPAYIGPNHRAGCDGSRGRFSGDGYNRVRVCACGAEDHAPADFGFDRAAIVRELRSRMRGREEHQP